eukprot:m.281817 g.281817  ORF g.281817 m.281817 type:complete len:98 (+) comp15754_c0_seq7:1332-1625(+)
MVQTPEIGDAKGDIFAVKVVSSLSLVGFDRSPTTDFHKSVAELARTLFKEQRYTFPFMMSASDASADDVEMTLIDWSELFSLASTSGKLCRAESLSG